MPILLKCPKGHRRELPDAYALARASCQECGYSYDIAAARAKIAAKRAAAESGPEAAATPAPARASLGNWIAFGLILATIMSLVVLVGLGGTIREWRARNAPISPLTWASFAEVFASPSYTALQKDEAWPQVEGLRVRWHAQVRGAQRSLSGALVLSLRLDARTVGTDLILTMCESERERVSTIRTDEFVDFEGTLASRGLLNGSIYTAALDYGVIVKRFP